MINLKNPREATPRNCTPSEITSKDTWNVKAATQKYKKLKKNQGNMPLPKVINDSSTEPKDSIMI